MALFKDKIGMAHPGWMLFIGLLLGLILAYLWVNYTNIPNPICKLTVP